MMSALSGVDAVLTLRDTRKRRTESTSIGERVEVLSPPGFALGGEHYVILIHGFNVSQRAACTSYAHFRWWLNHFGTRLRILELHWPGDSKWGHYGDPTCYPNKIPVADICGLKLAEWVSGAERHARFTLVGHSLGCRLIVRAVQELRAAGQLTRIVNVCLMAAAVPSRRVAQGAFGPNDGDRVRWRILYSKGDRVLWTWYHFGQTLGGDGVFSEAVGLHGEPRVRWDNSGDAFPLYHPTRFYNHGDYWRGGPADAPDSDKDASTQTFVNAIPRGPSSLGASAEYVSAMFGGSRARKLPLRLLAPPQTLPERILHRLFPRG